MAEYAPTGQKLIHLRPFLPQANLPSPAQGKTLLAVGMIRVAAKLPSYQLIAQVMALLPDTTQFEIAGDGPARAQVEAAMAPVTDRVCFLGALDPDALAAAYTRAAALIWPGVDEAFGMTYLEAQAHGLPVIAQDRAGVRDVLYPRTYPSVDAGAAGLATFAMAPAPARDDIRAYVAKYHLLPAAAATLRAGLSQVGVT